MLIHVNTDAHIQGTEAMIKKTESQIMHHIARFESRLTRVEVHISDENSDKKGGLAMKCVLEARMANHQPIAVSHKAETVDLAVDGAAEKLNHALTSVVGRLSDRG
jgi:ribosome-associated translation inhibitor RaiA